MEYPVGTTSFGSFPGVVAKAKCFSALTLLANRVENRQRKKNTERMCDH
jgi:hypothetical protein